MLEIIYPAVSLGAVVFAGMAGTYWVMSTKLDSAKNQIKTLEIKAGQSDELKSKLDIAIADLNSAKMLLKGEAVVLEKFNSINEAYAQTISQQEGRVSGLIVENSILSEKVRNLAEAVAAGEVIIAHREALLEQLTNDYDRVLDDKEELLAKVNEYGKAAVVIMAGKDARGAVGRSPTNSKVINKAMG